MNKQDIQEYKREITRFSAPSRRGASPPRRQRTKDESITCELTESPCLFCGYNGSGFYQTGTHHENCPWHLIGGDKERKAKIPKLMEKLFRVHIEADHILGYIDEASIDSTDLTEAMEAYEKELES